MSSVTDQEAIINGFVEFIHPAFVLAVANAAFSASLFTLFVVLLAHSTKESRRRMVLRLNVLAICLVFIMGALVGFSSRKFIVDRSGHQSPRLNIAIIAFKVFLPLLCDSILLTRLFALYPLSSTPRAILLKIFAFPFCVKCARVVVLALLVNDYARAFTMIASYNVFRNPNLIAEWTMQIADNMYSVSFFLYNLHVRTGSIKCGRMTSRIRQIFYISAANFVFPLMFNIVLLITIVTEQLYTIGGLLLLLLLINSYVTVMGVLCATVWFSRSEWVGTRNEPLPDRIFMLEPSLRRVHEAGRKGGSDIVMVGKRSSTPDKAWNRSCDVLQAATQTRGDTYYIV
ncbi:hypothetical protein EDC04DRAFT_1323569 [Pisolithus marmoratus]|nr:hypothetical protein EDC04DRAFT_1323569 [Pisolithus marmoratus]